MIEDQNRGGCEMDLSERDFDQAFLEVLQRSVKLPPHLGRIPMDSDLMEFGLDSIGAVQLLLDMEEAFGITIPESMIGVELYRSATALRLAVRSQVEFACAGNGSHNTDSQVA